MTRLPIAAAILALLVAAPAATAARPALTQQRADAAAEAEAAAYALELETSPWEIDACELERRRAYCDFTFHAGGEWGTCDGEFVVQTTRRGRLVVQTEILACDSDYAF